MLTYVTLIVVISITSQIKLVTLIDPQPHNTGTSCECVPCYTVEFTVVLVALFVACSVLVYRIWLEHREGVDLADEESVELVEDHQWRQFGATCQE